MNKKRKNLLRDLKRDRVLYLMILPAIVAVFIFHYIPLYGVQIAFKDYSTKRGIWGSEWVGFKYFIKFFQYPYFTRIMWNTLKINLVSLLTFPLPVIFALMLNEMGSSRLRKACQTITYAPHFVSTVVVCSMVMLFVGREGLINIVTGFFGKEAVDYMGSPAAFPWIYVISDCWSGLGWGSIIYTATLSGVSLELVEAARIDGASRMQVIWYVYLPQLKSTIIIMLILKMGSMLGVGFEKVFLLQNSLNLESSSVISTYVYQIGIESSQFSYSTAIGLFNSIVNIILVTCANQISKKFGESGLW